MKEQNLLLLLLILFLLSYPVQAQNSVGAVIAGTVLDSLTGKPLEGAHVFIASSMKGSVSDRQGKFLMKSVPTGSQRLYVSIVGYEPQQRDVLVRSNTRHSFTFRLKPAIIEVPELTVTADRDRLWAKRLKKFERLFIGESPNADSTRILNPEVLSFDGGVGKLIASASEPLEIENRALGYRIMYFLEEFISTGTEIRYDGEPLFEPIEPLNADESKRWEENRRITYHGSFRHFMRSVFAGRDEEEGFATYIRPSASAFEIGSRYPFPAQMMLSDAETDSTRIMHFPGKLEVIYWKEQESPVYHRWLGVHADRRQDGQKSWLKMTDGPAEVDWNGEILNPYGVTLFGYFAFERIADELPKEYTPE